MTASFVSSSLQLYLSIPGVVNVRQAYKTKDYTLAKFQMAREK